MMSEKRFVIDEEGISDNQTDKWYCWKEEVVDLLNEQQDHISYWKHKVNSLLWILSQFDEEKVKELLKEVEDE